MAGMAIIEIRGLSKRFGPAAAVGPGQSNTVQAVSDLSFDVEQGSVTGFLGANGAGKPVTGLRQSCGDPIDWHIPC
jgi:ABC-2 type transport system ATP-binding protein